MNKNEVIQELEKDFEIIKKFNMDTDDKVSIYVSGRVSMLGDIIKRMKEGDLKQKVFNLFNRQGLIKDNLRFIVDRGQKVGEWDWRGNTEIFQESLYIF